ncbi:hypothetical protein MIZ01_2163 [Sideroxyarcus emersonii]|uniref:Uncharacterized protein n=1 Tax=Sideroxyarcus emersonii TaxID=2764705 RepID=A0AAN2BZN1_9PROT|nr:nickel-dependent hydrogenase large subunit [Sideroxyarcus emersonii]BCK88360.1 hypothetical protein MIZ01_2163 [Sideroxyarcus emersonii]
MADIGKLVLGVIWDGATVRATAIRSSRPMAAQLLPGKTPAQVLHIVPLLFSVCGKAQGAASHAALQAARQQPWPEAAQAEQAILCEAMQEHLWRMLLDWPKLLGMAPQEQRFAAWYALLRQVAAGEIGMEVFRREFERDGLGMPMAEWRGMVGYPELRTWWRKADSPVAQLLSALDECDGHGTDETRLLPLWTAAEAQQACAGRWDADFSARPDWQGAAAEAGAWSYHAADPMLQEVWRGSGSRVLARLLARVIDVVEMAGGQAAPRLDAASPAPGEGVAVVRTARGLLMHHVRLAAEKVAGYAIVAPTEWNFHPDGAFAQDMRGLAARDRGRLQQAVQIAALSLDPCVAYEIEVLDA